MRLIALFSAGMAVHALYTVVYMRWAVMAWHFITFVPVGAIALAWLTRDVAARLSRATVVAALVVLSLLDVGALAISLSNLARTFTVAGREAGEWVAQNLPPDALLAMKDSGIFSYFAQRRVMNLDGLANSFEYAQSVCDGRLEEFLSERGVEYVAQHSVPPVGAARRLRGVHAGLLVQSARRRRRPARAAPRARGLPQHAVREQRRPPDQLVIWRIAD